MRAQSWTDIMSLLAVMVMTNKYEPVREQEVFTKGALSLRDMVAPNMRLSAELGRARSAVRFRKLVIHAATPIFRT